jgi:NADH:ubiquinone reductase (H+-translocating)
VGTGCTFGSRDHHVVVVGAGFGGLQAVSKLRRAPVEVTLVDRRDFHLFQPLTYQVATGALSPGEIAYPLRAIFKRDRNVRVLLADVADFDLDARELHLRSVSAVPAPERLGYDTLIVAGGSHYSYFGHQEWRMHAAEVKSLESALAVRSRLLAAFEAAEAEPNAEARDAWLTFVVVGAGATGVEMAGQIAELARDTLRRDFRTIDPRRARILLVQAADRVLTSFPPSLSAKAERSLQRLGVTVLTGRIVIGIDAAGVTLEGRDGGAERIASRAVIWAGGVTASGLAGRLAELTGTEPDRGGRITVKADLTLPGHPEVFAIGDMVRVRDPGGEPVVLPGLAPVAMQQGRYAASVVRARLTRARARRLPLPRQGQPGHDRPSSGSRRYQRRPAQRLSRLGNLAGRPPLVPDRLPEPAARSHPLVVQLRNPRSRRPTHHRRFDSGPRARRLRSRGPKWSQSDAFRGESDVRRDGRPERRPI